MNNRDKNQEEDWRRQGQEDYLYGKQLKAQEYRPYRKGWDHDHCEFCGVKLSLSNDDLKTGYSTVDGYYWICDCCYNDFKVEYTWIVHKA